MGFFDGLSRMAGGKPFFVDETQQSNKQPTDSVIRQTVSEPIAQQAKKYIPEVIIERIEYYIKDDDFSLNLHIANNSNVDVTIEKIFLFGKTADLREHLQAGESKEYVDVYTGDRVKHTSYKTVEVVYKDSTGDYFKSTHYVDYVVKDQGLYDIKNIKYSSPIREINPI